MNTSFTDYALLFKALSDETRLKIVSIICNKELCACNILEELHITQPTLSYHMKMLCDCKLIDARKDGQWMRYKINNARLKDVKTFIENLEIL